MILAVAFDLDRDEEGRIVLGPETKIACDCAVAEARMRAGPLIAVTAGCAPGGWNGFWMANAMREYIEKAAPGIEIIAVVGETFDTSGEMKALASIVAERKRICRAVIAVKWWHAWRAERLCRYWFGKKGVSHVPIEVVTCHSNVGWIYPAREWLLAIPKNLVKMALGRL